MATISDIVKIKSGYANFVELKFSFEADQDNLARMAMYRPTTAHRRGQCTQLDSNSKFTNINVVQNLVDADILLRAFNIELFQLIVECFNKYRMKPSLHR